VQCADEGGMACHAAIVSHELGCSAVVGTKGRKVLKEYTSLQLMRISLRGVGTPRDKPAAAAATVLQANHRHQQSELSEPAAQRLLRPP
jgi:phosphoenolpyruvate-protein kinase (PTS system EI component)